MKRNLIMALAAVSIIFTQDDFFEPGYTVGGYGELHYNRAQSGDDADTTKLDFHRFIIYFGYSFSEEWSFKSEVELEHNFVKDGDTMTFTVAAVADSVGGIPISYINTIISSISSQ